MPDFHSDRFNKSVWLTTHARRRMKDRHVDMKTVQALIEDGDLKRSAGRNIWLFRHIAGRADNPVCVAAVDSTALIIKTLMINWELDEEAP